MNSLQTHVERCFRQYRQEIPEFIPVSFEDLLCLVQESLGEEGILLVSPLARPPQAYNNHRITGACNTLLRVFPHIMTELKITNPTPSWMVLIVAIAGYLEDRQYSIRHPGTITFDRPAA